MRSKSCFLFRDATRFFLVVSPDTDILGRHLDHSRPTYVHVTLITVFRASHKPRRTDHPLPTHLEGPNVCVSFDSVFVDVWVVTWY